MSAISPPPPSKLLDDLSQTIPTQADAVYAWLFKCGMRITNESCYLRPMRIIMLNEALWKETPLPLRIASKLRNHYLPEGCLALYLVREGLTAEIALQCSDDLHRRGLLGEAFAENWHAKLAPPANGAQWEQVVPNESVRKALEKKLLPKHGSLHLFLSKCDALGVSERNSLHELLCNASPDWPNYLQTLLDDPSEPLTHFPTSKLQKDLLLASGCICTVCMTNQIDLRFPVCKHECCSDCAFSWIKSRMDTNRVNDITCMSCSTLFPPVILHKLLYKHGQYNRYSELLDSRARDAMNVVSCVGCAHGFDVTDMRRDGNRRFVCTQCGADQCWICREKWPHDGNQSCEAYQASRRKHSNDEALTAEFLSRMTSCPNCKTPYEKLDGCAHVKCTKPGCEYQWYWCCSRRYSSKHSADQAYHNAHCCSNCFKTFETPDLQRQHANTCQPRASKT